MLTSLAAVSVRPLLAVVFFSAYPLSYLLDMRITHRRLYLPDPDRFSQRERNIFLVAFEERFGFKKAVALQALVSFSVFLFTSLSVVPVVACYFGTSASLLERLASGAAVMTAVHLHAWFLNRSCVSK